MQQAQENPVISINWKLLFQRLWLRLSRLWKSAHHRLQQTDYTPPTWVKSFRFTWFRFGLVLLAIYVFTQKQIDFTLSVGKAGVSASQTQGASAPPANLAKQRGAATAELSMWSASPKSGQGNSWHPDQYPQEAVDAYLKRFTQLALTEAEKFHIPVAAKLAMGLLDSEAGTHPRAIENNNHFGNATPNGYYPSAWANWRAHSEMMQREFSQLANYSDNLQRWVKELDNTGYSDDPQYGSKLLAIIRHYKL